jgi:hypothetical protein
MGGKGLSTDPGLLTVVDFEPAKELAMSSLTTECSGTEVEGGGDKVENVGTPSPKIAVFV